MSKIVDFVCHAPLPSEVCAVGKSGQTKGFGDQYDLIELTSEGRLFGSRYNHFPVDLAPHGKVAFRLFGRVGANPDGFDLMAHFDGGRLQRIEVIGIWQP
jgi:hypothetical protein